MLAPGGLRAGVEALASRMPMPVAIEVPADRLPTPIEATAYFVVAEALANVAKHASAASVMVAARVDAGTLRVEVRDDGVGDVRRRSGLQGLGDRVAAIDGRLRIESPADGGTVVAAAIPIAGKASAAIDLRRCERAADDVKAAMTAATTSQRFCVCGASVVLPQRVTTTRLAGRRCAWRGG